MSTATKRRLRALAQKNGDMWGGKPILELDEARAEEGGPLFVCAEDSSSI